MKSGFYLPLTTARHRLGTLCFASHQAHHLHDAADLELLSEATHQVAVAVDNACMHKRLRNCGGNSRTSATACGCCWMSPTPSSRTLISANSSARLRPACKVFMPDPSMSSVLYDAERQIWRLNGASFSARQGAPAAGTGGAVANAPASRVYETRRPAIFNRADLEALGSDISRRLIAEGVQSLGMVPLLRTIGSWGRSASAEPTTFLFPARISIFWPRLPSEAALAVENALAYGRVTELRNTTAREKSYLEGEIRNEYDFTDIVGTSPGIREALRQVRIVAPADTTVLIQGETGTGKELIARAIHELSSTRTDARQTELRGDSHGSPRKRIVRPREGRPLPARLNASSGASNWPTRGRCFWMRLAIYRRNYSRSSCECCKNRSSKGSARRRRAESTCG